MDLLAAPGTTRRAATAVARGSRPAAGPRAPAPRPSPRATAVSRRELPREHLIAVQRRRVLAATVELAAERGAGAMSVAGVIGRAHVSRRTFYELFRDREDCFLAVFEETVEKARPELATAYEAGGSWSEGVRGSLARLLALIDAQPTLARVCIVDALGAGPRVLARRAAYLAELADVLDRGRAIADTPTWLSRVTAEAMTGAVFGVIHARLALDPPAPVSSLHAELLALVLLPYLGASSVARLTERERSGGQPDPRARSGDDASTQHADPLANLDMRLTYRTLVVLRAIAASPGMSNRAIADETGISDQGQASKLLKRLERLGLAANHSAGRERGAPNAWHLTPRGMELEGAARTR
jgi:AcrR family transcriptional regulator